MHKSLRRMLSLLVVSSLVLTSFGTGVLAQDQHKQKSAKAISIAADLAVVRPIGFVALVGGTIGYVLALPFAAMGGNASEVGDKLVAEPAKFIFGRPLGHFPSGSR